VPLTSFQFSPEGERAFVAPQGSNRIQIWNVAAGKVERDLNTPETVHRLAVSGDGSRILGVPGKLKRAEFSEQFDLTDDGGQALLLEVATGRTVATWPVGKGIWRSMALSRDGRLVASGDNDGTLHLWDAGTGRELAHWQAHSAAGITALAFHPDGHTLISGAADGTLKLWDLPYIRKELAALGLDW
jgi:WD40 repeat protein